MNIVIQKIKTPIGIASLFFESLLNKIRRDKNCNNQVTVLMFHHVFKKDTEKFKKLINELNNDYGFITQEEFDSFLLNKKNVNGKRFLLTFDDGFYSNYLVSKQILDPIKIKATFFISTDFIDARNLESQKQFVVKNLFNGLQPYGYNDEDFESMSWENVIEMNEMGHTIGAHTKSHLKLSQTTNTKQLEDEIIQSGDRIEKELNNNVKHFAFPFGNIESMSELSYKFAKKRYDLIYSAVRGSNDINTSQYSIKREAINLDDSLRLMKIISAGGLSRFYSKSRREVDRISS